MSLNSFKTWDIILFTGTLVMSLGIGLIYPCKKGYKSSPNYYFMGGGKLKLIPVSLSILVTNTTAIGILGTPAEIYIYGTQFSLQIIAMIIGNLLAAVVIVPLLYPLKLTSSFEVIFF